VCRTVQPPGRVGAPHDFGSGGYNNRDRGGRQRHRQLAWRTLVADQVLPLRSVERAGPVSSSAEGPRRGPGVFRPERFAPPCDRVAAGNALFFSAVSLDPKIAACLSRRRIGRPLPRSRTGILLILALTLFNASRALHQGWKATAAVPPPSALQKW